MLRSTNLCFRRRSAGIIGLPNVGKSTLFNALTCTQLAKTGNFPFCTIDANISKVPVLDKRLRALASFTGAKTVIDVEVDLVDVAGLIEGASKGIGIGNKFLADIRLCSVLLHMVRCFESARDGFGTPTPLEDTKIVLNELLLSDLEVMEKKIHKAGKMGKSSEVAFMRRVAAGLESGIPARDLRGPSATSFACAVARQKKVTLTPEEERWLNSYQLFSDKPMIFVLNVEESSVKEGNTFSRTVEEAYGADRTCRISASFEEQLSQMDSHHDRLLFLEEYGIDTPCSEFLIKRAYDLLRLQSFFTVGPVMAHGWTVAYGSSAREAAGEIHSDFEKHFLSAKVLPWDVFIKKPNLESAEMQMQKVDATYKMRDGDIMIVKHGAVT
ncbi:unnamed protein product [Phytomonas sp. Hart1]|nr:unnamed protein product [Phytomonas sp. Hart1]|eukprot:CCW70502.1 unnamed protein product [Phytomonas sp. isolate Hart1]